MRSWTLLALWTSWTILCACGSSENAADAGPGAEDGSASGSSGSSGGAPSDGESGSGGSSGSLGASGSGGSSGTSGSSGLSSPSSGAGSTASSGSSGSSGTSSSSGSNAASDAGSPSGPCDLYRAGGTPCVAAHSTVRALYGSYAGHLYQVRRASDATTKDVGVSNPGGVAAAATQDSFCASTTCTITMVYDQSGHGNDLAYQGPGGAGGQDTPASATGESVTAGGGKVYSLYVNPGNSYWKDGSSSGIPTGSAPEGLYMVTSGTHVNSGCCFDYGNSETNRKVGGNGAMDAINFSTSCWFKACSGSGPWVQADLEDGLYQGGSTAVNPANTGVSSRFVTAMLKNDGTTALALKGGNAQSGALTTYYSGALPPGFSPMHKQGAIVLGSGGDCCATNTNQSEGTFYEGALVAGSPSDATDDTIQANVVAAGYRP
jgi:non-reducing end alpha-L-arabinofuranosidase